MDKFEETKLLDAYQSLFKNPSYGNIVMKDLGEFCHISETSVTENPHIVYMNEGKRLVFLYILDKLKIDPVTFLMELSEAENDNDGF